MIWILEWSSVHGDFIAGAYSQPDRANLEFDNYQPKDEDGGWLYLYCMAVDVSPYQNPTKSIREKRFK